VTDDLDDAEGAETSGRLLHPMLLTAAGGALACSVVFDVASKTGHETMWARAAMWLVVLGLAGVLVGLATGLVELRRLPPASAARRSAATGMKVTVLAAVLFGASLVVRRTRLDQLIDGSPVVSMVLSVAGLVVLAAAVRLLNDLVRTSGAPAALRGGGSTMVAGRAPKPDPTRPVHPAVAATRERRRSEAAD
jgi:uncharacterized membrane protein